MWRCFRHLNVFHPLSLKIFHILSILSFFYQWLKGHISLRSAFLTSNKKFTICYWYGCSASFLSKFVCMMNIWEISVILNCGCWLWNIHFWIINILIRKLSQMWLLVLKKLNILKILDTEKKKKNPESEFPRNCHSTGCDNFIQCEVLQTWELVF